MTTEEKYTAVKRLLRECPDILTPIKAARWLHCSKNNVYANINDGSLPAYLYRSSYLIAKADLSITLLPTPTIRRRKSYITGGTTMNEYALLPKQYPPVLCVDQARQILHVSKRKMVWMLEHDYVAYTDNGKKTRQYRIELESLIAYIKASRRHPEQYPLPIVFSSGCKSTPKPKPQTYVLHPGEIPKDFSKWLGDEWYRVPDMLTANDVATLLGYDRNTVRRCSSRARSTASSPKAKNT